MDVSLMFVGVRQQNGCFDTHTFIQFSTYGPCSGQGQFTLHHIWHVPYQERLEKLGLHSLFHRRKRGDMISVFKMMTGRTTGRQLFDVFEQGGRTRGHKYKMKKSLARKDIKKHRFAQRVINSWNSLPSSVVEADSVASFKTRLDEYWSSMKYSLD